jgi:hypothetical protein
MIERKYIPMDHDEPNGMGAIAVLFLLCLGICIGVAATLIMKPSPKPDINNLKCSVCHYERHLLDSGLKYKLHMRRLR